MLKKHKQTFILAAAFFAVVGFIASSALLQQGNLYSGNVSLISVQNTTPIWPIAGTSVANIHDTFGPRYKLIDGKVSYVFHHGIDIKKPIGTPILAILNGKVTTIVNKGCPSHCQYRVEIKHTDANNQTFYSSYQHLTSVNVIQGSLISQGAVIGTSGWDSYLNYPHLHFEIRLPSDYEKNSVSPLNVLPYDSTVNPTVTILGVNNSKVSAQTIIPAYQQDITGVEMMVYDNKGDADPSNDTLVNQNVYSSKYDFAQYSLDPSKYNTIQVEPTDFNSSSTEQKVKYTFTGLTLPANGHTTFVFRSYNAKGQYSDATLVAS